MKKLLLILLASSLLLASCGDKTGDETTAGTTAPDAVVTDTLGDETTAPDAVVTDTLGDENGDGLVEEETPVEPGAPVEGDSATGAVSSVASAEDAVAFIDNNVYSLCQDQLPMAVVSNILPMDDPDMIAFNTGLTDLTGVTDIIVSESMVGSFPYSFIMVRTDGTNTDDIQKALNENVNPEKWICVWADQIRSVRLDNDIILVMFSEQRTEPIMDAVVKAAEGVYSEIGSVVNVLG